MNSVDALKLPLGKGETVEELCEEVFPVIFDSEMMPKRVNQADGEDLVLTSAANYYEGVTQKEAEDFYHNLKNPDDMMPVMFGMNSRLVKEDGKYKKRSGDLEDCMGKPLIRSFIGWIRLLVWQKMHNKK